MKRHPVFSSHKFNIREKKVGGINFKVQNSNIPYSRLKNLSRPRAPNRKKTTQAADERIRLEAVSINEADLVEEEEEPEKLETQEQAIAALKSAKQLLKSPTKKSPYPEVMLIQIRGVKHTDVRLVAPSMSSIHENACFVVVHQNHLLKYEGAHANILEKTKAAQLCIEIQGKSDLNCSADTIVAVTESSKSTLSKLLFCSENCNPSAEMTMTSSSEPFESTAVKLNLVFRIADDRSAQTCSRRERLSVGILQSSETLIFDFGSEIYVWTGRNSSKVNAAYAMEYAKQLMGKAVKNGKAILGDSDASEDDRRPKWTLFRKIHQGVLDTLFKAKFSDWPETREVITSCKPKALFSAKKADVKTYEDVKIANQEDEVENLVGRMLDEPEVEPILMLEDQEIDRKMHDVITEDTSLWILGGEILNQIEFTEQFDSTRCYVLRWQYRIQKSGVRRIKTGREEERETGRSRIAFFYWLGEHTSPKQHGLCALRIKDIDRDNSPRIRVADGNEPALFLALFDGKFMVSSSSSNSENPIRRFVVVGANSQETSLREVADLEAKLRSHATYIEMTPKNESG
uniref:Gelsolin-like domain-containing protein n=1 Tax=Caenorhabditis japonica TaxID=281687 RepID=A0A8R1EEL3_CAEJA